MITLNKKQKNVQVEKLEKQLAKLCDRIYDLAVDGRRIIPFYPYLLTRVLPKEHVTAGGILLPENDQNKPVHEFLVIATWRPWDEIREKTVIHSDVEFTGTDSEQIVIHHESSFKPGDRIAAPHYEGISLAGYLDDKYYRLVREITDQKNMPYCGVLGKIDYQGDAEVSKKIKKLTSDIYSVTTSGVSMSRGDNPRTVN